MNTRNESFDEAMTKLVHYLANGELDKATDAILTLIQSECNKARADELENISYSQIASGDECAPKIWIEDRIAELKEKGLGI